MAGCCAMGSGGGGTCEVGRAGMRGPGMHRGQPGINVENRQLGMNEAVGRAMQLPGREESEEVSRVKSWMHAAGELPAMSEGRESIDTHLRVEKYER